MKTHPRIPITIGLTLLALHFVLGGCATERVMTTGAKYPPTTASSIKIYQAAAPTAPYEEIGRVSVDKYNNLALTRNGDQMNALLREKAASIGGEAIISITEDFASISGVVIRFKTAP